MPKVLISDKLSPGRRAKFSAAAGSRPICSPALRQPSCARSSAQYDGLAIRSATKVTKELLDAATQPEGGRPRRHRRRQRRCEGRDRPRRRGDEYAARQRDHHGRTRDRHDVRAGPADPGGERLDQSGEWEKNRFMGVELTGKTLGLIGCGNIGSIVADRAIGLSMKVLAYDPFSHREARSSNWASRRWIWTLCSRAPILSRCTRR